MGERLIKIIDRLKSEGNESLNFFRALPSSAWATQIYDIGPEWDVREILCHFVSAESSLVELFKRIVATGEGVSEDFDIDRWNNSKVSKMREMLPDELIRQFEVTRARTVSWTGTLEEPDLDKVGRHPFLGMVELEQMLKLLYRHNMLHQRDVTRALSAGSPIPPSD